MVSIMPGGHVLNSCAPRPVEEAQAEPLNHSTRDALTIRYHQNKKLSNWGLVKRQTNKQCLLKSEPGPSHSALWVPRLKDLLFIYFSLFSSAYYRPKCAAAASDA